MNAESEFKQHPNIKEIAEDFDSRIEKVKTVVIIFETSRGLNYRFCCPDPEYAIRMMKIVQEEILMKNANLTN